MAENSGEEDSDSLADCQRGSYEQRLDENGNPIPTKPKIKKTYSKTETIPLFGTKKSSISLYEPIMRKQIFTQASSLHTIRERK